MIYPKAPFHDGVVFRGFCFILEFLFSPSSYHEFMYKSVECGIVKFKNEPWKGRRTYYFLGF
jgi:hypothetical protein